MEDIDRSLSIKLYDVMDQVGVSEKIRKLYQDTAIMREIVCSINSQIHNTFYSVYMFGSYCEGATTEGLHSDIDVVYCHERYPVIDDINDAARGLSYLIVRDDHTYPGYVKLQMVYDRTPMTIFNAELPDDHDTDTEGRICKKHVTKIEPNDHAIERHGPSDAQPENENLIAYDTVYALRCRAIPLYDRTWLHRQRRYHWPSRENLLKMGDFGCFVVGVGHSSSREPHIEWRLSFSLQERLIMFSLNPTQHKCYVLLKMIKKNIMAEIGECISSYHCKTCLCHAIENTPAAIWTPDNLVCCVRLCLLILFTWSIKGACPIYFIPLENMFEKPQFRDNRYRLLDKLRALISDDWSVIMRLQCDDIRNRILQPEILHNNMSNSIIVYRLCLQLNGCISWVSYAMYGLANNSQSIHQLVVTLSQHIERLKNTRVIDEHTEQHYRDAISYVIPVLHLHIAQRLASLVCKAQGQEHARQLLYLSIHHFQLCDHADLMSARFLVVSLLLRLEKYDLCEIILEEMEHDVKRYVVTDCNCYVRCHVGNVDLMKHLSTNNVSCKTAIRTVYVGCVRFARSDTEIAPLPLQYEMYRSMGTPPGSRDEHYDNWFDLASVDGKIYLYFLQYLVYTRLNKPANKKVAIDNLVWVIENDHNLQHQETAYNLLGWILVKEGHIREALRCFVASWEIRPDHNAAKLHVLLLAQAMMLI